MAEHPILEAMARAFAAATGPDEWDDYGPKSRAEMHAGLLAALRSLAEAGPTPGMLDAVAWREEYAPSADDFRAMLRALLEEVEAAHG